MDNHNKISIEWGLSVLNKYSKLNIKKRLSHLKLNKSQLLFILHLKFADGIRQDHLTKIFKMNRITIARSIKTMKNLGYIDKKTDEYNRTANFIFLTSKGHIVFNEIYSTLQEWVETITNGFTDTETETCTYLLLRMTANACMSQGDDYTYNQIMSKIKKS
jgi:DNA-binding MarR family transcriptional regulator